MRRQAAGLARQDALLSEAALVAAPAAVIVIGEVRLAAVLGVTIAVKRALQALQRLTIGAAGSSSRSPCRACGRATGSRPGTA